eukprot:TRINITY_DN113_c0_g1_i14.p1 TRINITY_DN113_c0_g1~~TRINITY_DN113_c0_g1_i14.p1  ORF type:complete len:722 (-),score=126.80 TRINITY_DN113_c0_g1_i14:3367-5532(-)
MNSPSQLVPASQTVAGLRWERTLHICMLCAFAFSEPLFSALTQQFVYLHDLQIGWTEIGAVLLTLMILVPAFWILLDQLAIKVASRFGGVGQYAVLAFLLCVVCLSVLRPFMRYDILERESIVFLTSMPIAVACAAFSTWLYARNSWVRGWFSLASLGILCFPGMFVLQFASLRQPLSDQAQIKAANPVPVVMIVFDEFSGTTLMNRDLQVDSQRFPQFARLAEMSTWYRQASTVHTRTDVAVPALLSGQFPATARPALDGEFPGNLFRLIHGTQLYDMTVYEPVTRLCPPELLHRELIERTSLEKLQLLGTTLLAVYPRLILPNDTPVDFPRISKVWFGLPEKPEKELSTTPGLYRPNPFFDRHSQIQFFVNSLKATPQKQSFYFLHIEVPHLPWCFLPSGHNYNFDDVNSFQPPGGEGDIWENWTSDTAIIARNEHRYLLQLGFADHFLGQVLDRLQETDLLEKCLLIVTADHGVSFRPGHSRRVPDAKNLPDVLSIPLFVKFPGKPRQQVSDQNVESVDILPTIAEVLGIELPHPIDGSSITQSVQRPRKSLYYEKTMLAIEPFVPRLKEAVSRRWDLFEGTDPDTPPKIAMSHPDWCGMRTSEFPIEDHSIPSLQMLSSAPNWTETSSEFVPCLVAGTLHSRDERDPIDLVVAANGIIRDSGGTFARDHGYRGFEFLLPESVVAPAPCRIEVFQVAKTTENSPKLRRLMQWTVNEQN